MIGGKRFAGILAVALVAVSVTGAHAASSRSSAMAPRSFVAENALLKKKVRPMEAASLDSRDLTTRGGADEQPNQLVSASALFVFNYVVNKVFKANDIAFPSQLGGCIILFISLLLADAVKDGLGNDIFTFLSPGAALYAKWLPVFFVPGLAMLPRAPSLGSTLDVLKILFVVVSGFLYTLTTVTYAVLFVRGDKAETASNEGNKKAAPAPAPSKPYSEETLKNLVTASAITGAVSIAATNNGYEYQTPLQTIFFTLSTLASYVFSARLPSDFTKVVHPLVTTTAMTLGLIRIVAGLTGSTFMDMLATYKVGSMNWKVAGAGDLLLYMLGPAVVSFAISMYSRKKLLKDNLSVVVTAMLVSSVGGTFGTAFLVRLLQIGGSEGGNLVRLSLISRNVTTALSMAIADILGGDISIAASVVIMAGIIGATYGRAILNALGVNYPVARGLGIGASSQGLGVASLISEPDAFPFAAMSMILTAVSATSLVSIPAVRNQMIKIATGA